MARPLGIDANGVEHYIEKTREEKLLNAILFQFRNCSIINYNLMNTKNLEIKVARLIKEFYNA